MLNQVILVGEVEETFNHPEVCVEVVVKVTNKDNSKHTIRVQFPTNMSESILSYCNKGATIGVKAHLEHDGKHVRVIGEKVTFINK